jgi:hypothetical protein
MILFSAVALALTASLAAAQGGNASFNYSLDKTISGTLPVADSYVLTVTSPDRINRSGSFPQEVGLTVSAADYPLGSSEAQALALVSLGQSSLTYTALSEQKTVTVSVSASSSTVPGDYAFLIRADPAAGIGWGAGDGHTLVVSVAAPTLVDITPPNVQILEPTPGQEFLFCSAGTPVSLTVNASDAETFVTNVYASVNNSPVTLSSFTPANSVTVSGTFSAADIGSYTVKAWATNTVPLTSDPDAAKVTIAVNYALSFLPPLSLGKTAKGGSTMPIKFTVRDCVGAFVQDTRVTVEVWEGATRRFTATLGDSSTSVRIDAEAEQYITNFQTAAGTHDYTVRVLFNGIVQGTRPFSTR